jgi:hypothetical protein
MCMCPVVSFITELCNSDMGSLTLFRSVNGKDRLHFHIILMLNNSNNIAASLPEWHKYQMAHREIFGYF